MTHSDQLHEIATALAKARTEFAAFVKDQTAKVQTQKGGYSYRYGDLAALFEATTPALSKHGLAISQWPALENSTFVLVTFLLHSSGQWMRGAYPLATYERPQEQGSAITYAKRYAAASVLGVAAEADDDGAAAQNAEPVYTVEKPAATRDTGPLCVTKVAKKNTTNPNVKRYEITFSDGRMAATIKDQMAALAEQLAQSGEVVDAMIEQGKYGLDLVELRRVRRTPPEYALSDDVGF